MYSSCLFCGKRYEIYHAEETYDAHHLLLYLDLLPFNSLNGERTSSHCSDWALPALPLQQLLQQQRHHRSVGTKFSMRISAILTALSLGAKMHLGSPLSMQDMSHFSLNMGLDSTLLAPVSPNSMQIPHFCCPTTGGAPCYS